MRAHNGWRADLQKGRSVEDVCVPIHMKMERWEAVLEVLAEQHKPSAAMVEAWQQITVCLERVRAEAASQMV